MKQRIAAMVLSLAVWSCALQPAAGPRPGREPQAEEERGSTAAGAGAVVEPLAGDATAGADGAAAAEAGGVAAVNAERAGGVVASAAGAGPAGEAGAPLAEEGDEASAPWVDPEIDLEYLALRVLAEANAVRMRAGA